MSNTRPHPLATRKAALRRIAKGEMRAEVCRQLGIDPKTLRKWIREQQEGKVPGHIGQHAPQIPVDEAPGALGIAQHRKLDEVLALTLPVGSPAEMAKNVLAQKLARALQDSPVPVPTKTAEWCRLAAALTDLLGLTGKTAAKPSGGGANNLTVRMEVVSRQPRSVGQPRDAEIVEVSPTVTDAPEENFDASDESC